jgi:hypothetical protein
MLEINVIGKNPTMLHKLFQKNLKNVSLTRLEQECYLKSSWIQSYLFRITCRYCVILNIEQATKQDIVMLLDTINTNPFKHLEPIVVVNTIKVTFHTKQQLFNVCASNLIFIQTN